MINFLQIPQQNAENMYFYMISDKINKGEKLRPHQRLFNDTIKIEKDYIDVEYEVIVN
jgi:hypothetical protein